MINDDKIGNGVFRFIFFLLCLIGRFIFCLLHTAAAGLAGWVVLIFASCI